LILMTIITPLAQHHKGVVDLEVGPSNRDMALIVQACKRVGVDSSAGDVVDLLETLPALTDGMHSRSIRNDNHDKVAVGLALLSERLSEGEGDGIGRYSSLCGRMFLLGPLGV
jgi:hypothetical protein